MNASVVPSNVDLLLEGLDIPQTAYDKADARYRDLGSFFSSAAAKSAKYDPSIYPQGSFRIGTVVRPLRDDDEFDLDIGCRLTRGVTKLNVTQEQLKELIGDDLRRYREQRGISKALEEKRRCWRLSYKDEMRFHMDVVPSIPEEDRGRQQIREAIAASFSSDHELAAAAAEHTGVVTDNTSPNYKTVSPNWKVSNSEGYALWFESRMLLARTLMESRAVVAKTTIAELPARKWGSPLQDAVRILKRHRDHMYLDNEDSKPISIIITTLAAMAYRGETTVDSALAGVLARMEGELSPLTPRVPNPVNPKADFADKWAEPAHAHLELEENFHQWLAQARRDFAYLQRADAAQLVELAESKFGARLNSDRIEKALGGKRNVGAPAIITSAETRPWTGL